MKLISPLLLRFLHTEATGGLLLMVAAVMAVAVANSPLAGWYGETRHGLEPWVNDGAMALFFLLVGLEIKREMVEGELASWPQRLLPGLAALGGMVVPAGIYAWFNWGQDSVAGWAIPSATDIAFALGVLVLLGKRVPTSLKVFLTALAILDDLGAIGIIAAFYTDGIAWLPLGLAGVVMAVLVGLNRAKVVRLEVYLGLGVLLWGCVYSSGLHATLAGVLLAMTVPMAALKKLEHGLQPWVALAVMPLFGFLNAGVTFAGMDADVMAHPVALGTVTGLVAGKQIGVGLGMWAAIKLLKAPAPAGANAWQMHGVAMLCGIGFTMSLFIGNMALSEDLLPEMRLGILVASGISALGAVGVFMVGRRK